MKKKVKILVIDDEPNIIYTFKAIAGIEDWEVEGFVDPRKGLKKAISNNYDIILVDFHMLELDGLEVVKRIRKKDTSTPILVLTIDERYEIAQKFLETGANDYALKPLKAADLISRIKVHLNEKKFNNIIDIDKLSLPKGLSKTTFKKIFAHIKEKNEYFTIDEISKITGFAYQTVHRYLDYLEEEEILKVDLNYGERGRPTKKYKIN